VGEGKGRKKRGDLFHRQPKGTIYVWRLTKVPHTGKKKKGPSNRRAVKRKQSIYLCPSKRRDLISLTTPETASEEKERGRNTRIEKKRERGLFYSEDCSLLRTP